MPILQKFNFLFFLLTLFLFFFFLRSLFYWIYYFYHQKNIKITFKKLFNYLFLVKNTYQIFPRTKSLSEFIFVVFHGILSIYISIYIYFNLLKFESYLFIRNTPSLLYLSFFISMLFIFLASPVLIWFTTGIHFKINQKIRGWTKNIRKSKTGIEKQISYYYKNEQTPQYKL
jgi:hypothetical protein